MRTIEPLESRVLLSALPSGFSEATVANLNTTTAATMAFTPDGRLFVGDSTRGQIRVIENGALLTTPALTLQVDRFRERGINGIAFAPNFASAPAGQKYVFIYYTTADPAHPNTAPNNAHNRLSRFTFSASNPDLIDPASEKILLDGIPSDTGQHNGGMLKFGADGMLYLAIGDGEDTPQLSQNLSSLNGKILRLNVSNLSNLIPSDNPYINTAGARPEIWASGLRNPFTGDFVPGTSTLYVNDVGENTWEEIDQIQKGGNFGWPTAEGNSSNPAFINPVYEYGHTPGVPSAIVGGAFYEGSNFPIAYDGKYFFGDYNLKTIHVFDPATKTATLFASGTMSIDNISVSPTDGSLWYLSQTGKVERISYTNPSSGPIRASNDAYVQDGALAGSNFGQSTQLDVKKSTPGYNREAYLSFDTQGISSAGSATLMLYGQLSSTENSSVGVGVYSIADTSFGENTIGYNNSPASGANAIATQTITGTSPRWYAFDVTSYVRQHLNSAVAFDIKGLASSLSIVVFNSDEAGANQPQLVIAPGSTGTTLRASADTYVQDGAFAGDNFGQATELDVKKSTPGYNREAYLSFNTQGVSSAGSAMLMLYGELSSTESASVAVGVYSVTNTSFGENTTTYNNKPACGSAAIAAQTIAGTSPKWYAFDVTSYVQQHLNSAVAFDIKGLANSLPIVVFNSDEAGANQPQLVISPSSSAKTLAPTNDAFVRDGSYASSNFGTSDELDIKKSTASYNREAYLTFDLSTVGTIASAKLELFGGLQYAPDSPVQIAAYAVADTSWSQAGITYANRPATSGNPIATVTLMDGAIKTYTWDLTAYLQSQKSAGHTIVSIDLRALNSALPLAQFASSEAGANGPALIIS